MTDDARPKPPIAADVDLRTFDWMPLDLVLLENSETWMLACTTPFAAAACINIWRKAWHQVPAGSLPNNDAMHRMMAQVPNWDDVRDIALRNFIECSDGRLYHKTICEKAKEAWAEKQRYRKAANARWKKKKANNATHSDRDSDAPEDASKTQQANPDASQCRGTGTGTGTVEEYPSVSTDVDTSGPPAPPTADPADDDGDLLGPFDRRRPSSIADPPPDDASDEVLVFREGKALLGTNAGGLIAKLVKTCRGDHAEALRTIREAEGKQDPREWVGRVVAEGVELAEADREVENTLAQWKREFEEAQQHGTG